MVPYVMKSYSSSEGLLLSISQEFVSLINFYIEGQRLRGTNSSLIIRKNIPLLQYKTRGNRFLNYRRLLSLVFLINSYSLYSM